MRVVIEIPDKVYTYVKRGWEESKFDSVISHVFNGIINGVVLPEHHGRLIDADALREDFKASKKISFAERMNISCIVDHAPTIIEGSDSE